MTHDKAEEVWRKLDAAIIYKDEHVGDWLPPDVAVPIIASYGAECRAQGVRDMRAAIDKRGLIVRWDEIEEEADRLLSSAPEQPNAVTRQAPEAPDKLAGLRGAILAQYIKLALGEHAPGGSQCVGLDWYAPRWGCDTLEHVLDAVSAALEDTR